MPSRRSIGYALQNVSDMLSQVALHKQQQDRAQQDREDLARLQDQLRRSTNEQEARLKNDSAIMGEAVKNPIFARQQVNAGNKTPGLDPTDDTLMLPTLEDIGKADNPSKLLTPEEVTARAKGVGVRLPYGYGILDIPSEAEGSAHIARTAREKMLQGEANKPTEFVETFNPQTGAMEKVATNPRTQTTPLQTKPGTQQSIAIANQTEAGTRAGKAKTAGAVTGAQESARNAAELAQLTDPRWLRAQTEKIRQEGIAKALAEQNKDQAEFINKASTTVASITPDWEKMKILSQKVNTNKNAAQVGTYYVTSPLQLNKDATELDSIGQNIAKRLANDPLFGGNKGAQSEKDSQAIADRLPNSYDTRESAQRKVKDFEDNLYKGLEAMSNLKTGATPADKINMMRQSIGLPAIDLANPPGPSGSELENRWDQFMSGNKAIPQLSPIPTHRR